MDTIVQDSINGMTANLASSILLYKKYRYARSQRLGGPGPACEYNDDVLAPLMLAPALDRED
ncbi:MAG: hypothetical protein MJE68_32200, partial [Proteobacteria bacterium]|nr:hypothetical protein [Pseudomonadota bacterium]